MAELALDRLQRDALAAITTAWAGRSWCGAKRRRSPPSTPVRALPIPRSGMVWGDSWSGKICLWARTSEWGYRPRTAVDSFAEAAGRAALALGARPDLVCSFAAPVNLERAAEGIAAIHERSRPKALVGCGAQGVVGEGREVETGGVTASRR